MIRVGKKWDKGAQYIGRGSPLGNPFVMRNSSIEERNRVCDEYHTYLLTAVANGDPDICRELSRLRWMALNGDLVLGCFCAPKRCHGDSVKQVLEEHHHEF